MDPFRLAPRRTVRGKVRQTLACYDCRVLRWLLASVVVISACGSNSPPTPPCSKRLQKPPPPTVLLTLVGQPITASLDFPLVLACAGGNPIATSAVTEVLDAQLLPVPHDSTAPTSSDTQGYSTRVTFTPMTPGLYSLSARFEPGLGIARREVLVVIDRTAEAPAVVFTPEAPCDALGEVPPFVLCERSADGVVDVYLGGARVQTEAADFVSPAPGAAWTRAGETVTRWVPGDGGLDGTTFDGLDVGAAGLTHAAEDDVLRFVAGDAYRELRAIDGGLVATEVRTLEVAASGRSGLLVLDGGAALGFDAQPDGGVLTTDAGLLLNDGGMVPPTPLRTVCRVDLSGVDGGPACTSLTLELGARQDDALWLRAPDTGRVGLLRYRGATGGADVVFLAAQPFALQDQGRPFPYFTWNTYTVVLRTDDLLLEAFKPPAGRVKAGASPTHVWFVTQDGSVALHRR